MIMELNNRRKSDGKVQRIVDDEKIEELTEN